MLLIYALYQKIVRFRYSVDYLCCIYCLVFTNFCSVIFHCRRVAKAALDDLIEWLRNGGEVAVSSLIIAVSLSCSAFFAVMKLVVFQLHTTR